MTVRPLTPMGPTFLTYVRLSDDFVCFMPINGGLVAILSSGRFERAGQRWPTTFLILPILIISHDALVSEFDQPTLDLLSGVSDRHKIDDA